MLVQCSLGKKIHKSSILYDLLGNDTESLVSCPCNSSENCFSFEDSGTEICGCKPGYIQQMDNQDNQMCTGNIIFRVTLAMPIFTMKFTCRY